MKRMLTMFLLLLFSLSALAVTEGKIEDAPPVDVGISMPDPEGYYLPDESYYAQNANHAPSWEYAESYTAQSPDNSVYTDYMLEPRLTEGEKVRLKALEEAYRRGEAEYTGESVVNKRENVIVGVYPLNQMDFSGESVYVILPATCLTDDELLSLISAFDSLSCSFDPELLTYKNCMRGGAYEEARFMTEEEYGRLRTLAMLLRRGKIGYAAYDGAPLLISLCEEYFGGLSFFRLAPFRRMTDSELVVMLTEMGYTDESGHVDFDGIEKSARSIAFERLNRPLSMQLSDVFTEGSFMFVPLFENGEKNYDALENTCAKTVQTFGAVFEYVHPDGYDVSVVVAFENETGKLLSASAMDIQRYETGIPVSEIPDELTAFGEAPEITCVPFSMEMISESIEAYRLPADGWSLMENTTATNWGSMYEIKTLLDDGYWFSFFVSVSDGAVHGVEITADESLFET